MRRTTLLYITLIVLLVSGGGATFAQGGGNYDLELDHPAFAALWNRTDLAVLEAASDQGQDPSASWLWGNGSFTENLREPYAPSPGGTRLVQYFDKARMEINDLNADPDSPWFVTTGLLPVELITGRIQVGVDQFEQRQPATIAAIGDPDNPFPTYADLATVFTRQGAGDQVDTPVTRFFAPDDTTSSYDAYRDDPATVIATVENQHGIPAGFLNYMNQQSEPLDRLFAFGQPVSAAYWTNVRVGGQEQPVMFQVFERRILTYTPSNRAAFQVESGNVGRHYLMWRYPIPTIVITPPEGPVGTTFTVEVIGLPMGEEAPLRVYPALSGAAREFTVTGSDQPVQVSIPTTPDDSIGNWSVIISRPTISTDFISVTEFTVTAPE